MWVSAPRGKFFFINWGYAHRPKHKNTVLSQYQPPVLNSRAPSPGPRGNGKWISLAFPGCRASQMETHQEENCPQEPLAHPSLVHPPPLPTLALFPGFRFALKYILHTASPITSCSPHCPSIPSGTLTSPRGSRWDSPGQFGHTAGDSSAQPTHQCLPLERAKSRLGCSSAAGHRVKEHTQSLGVKSQCCPLPPKYSELKGIVSNIRIKMKR